MTKSSQHAHKCCSMEKKHLVEELRKCDMCTDSHEALHQCYRDAAKESGRRARSCIIA